MSGESEEHDATGPVHRLVMEFPAGSRPDEGLLPLAGLVDRGVIRILDLAFVRKHRDGAVEDVEPFGPAGDGGAGLAPLERTRPGLLGREDADEAAAALAPGGMAGVLVYENLWAGPFAAALRRSGGRVVVDGRAPAGKVRRRDRQDAGPARSGPAPEDGPPPVTLPADEEMRNKIAHLKELGDLRSRGVLSDHEFQAQKARLLTP
ncbi:SHOCT domain-containing protein [Streptomyces sp. PTD5-9]|uniref:SHOCT domain-containing protein n=1 Tax=Streptomyces sp. PTD5-9 TaxID=3120150 RepID=UPI003008A2E3